MKLSAMNGFKLGWKMLSVVCIVCIVPGCSHRVALDGNRLMKKQTVMVTMKNGRHISGEIRDIDERQIIVIDDDGRSWAADRSQIIKMTGPEPVFDHHNQIISERDIKLNKSQSNFWLFTISGGLVSAGCGFFLSSMLSRADDSNRDTIIVGGTSLSTLAGSYLFARMGAKKDRQQAIKKTRYLRELDEQYISEEDRKRRDIEQELKELKKERQMQDQELETLRQQIREKDRN